ncbi:MAG TPA: phospholipase D-like domain-containing protein [Gemmatimonadales bacterium]|nr:phospholipase D-like domain-containing protein [Gemmatimonadales bacterium]
MAGEFQVTGENTAAPFTLKIHRGEGMALLAMNWKAGKPPRDFVGFAIEYREPGGDRFYALKNRIAFPAPGGEVNSATLSTRLSPIQKFRWIHFPRNAHLAGKFTYRVTPVLMNPQDELSYGAAQEAAIELRGETLPGKLNVAFTRGFVSSQAFVDRYVSKGPVAGLLPKNADGGLDFEPTHPLADDALEWMGFEARQAILDVLDRAVADKKAQVRVVAYDLSEPGVVTRLEKLGKRLRVIIDDDGPHGKPTSPETRAAKRLAKSAGKANVKRQHLGKLQHNKTIVVDGPTVKAAVCGSTNFTWRGFYVQANNALVLQGAKAVKRFSQAFDDYWANDKPTGFGQTGSAKLTPLGLAGVKVSVGFSPFAPANAMLAEIGEDVGERTRSSLFYSLAFLYQTKGPIRDAIEKVTKGKGVFVYGISDRKVGGLDLQKPDGNVAPVRPAALAKDVPQPFKSEPTGGGGNRMHHKFLVIDFDKPTARVYLGSYNFSAAADTKNGENLVLVRDRRVATAYTVEALRLFDHYHFRVAQQESKKAKKKLQLAKPPAPGKKPWWDEHFTSPRKVRDRELFA